MNYEAMGAPDSDTAITTVEIRRQKEAERVHEWARRVADQAPPLTDAQAAHIAQLLRRVGDGQLVTWRLRLYCGRVVDRSAHASHRTVTAGFHGSVDKCPACGLSPATIVAARAMA